MNRTTWTLLLGIVAATLLSQEVQAQSYSPGPAPIVGAIQTLCVEQYPAPQTRTDVGIGEQVSCWIASWSDTDIYTDAYGNQSNVSDSVGSVTWSVSGSGSFYPTVTSDLSQVTLTIGLADADFTVTITATVADSGKLGVDPLQQKQLALNAKVPSGVEALSASDQPNPAWQPPDAMHPAANIGGRTFVLYELQPNNVNLNAVPLRENLPAKTFQWPDGTQETIPLSTPTGHTATTGAQPNLATALIGGSIFPIGRIAGQNFSVPGGWPGNLEFNDKLDMSGNWNPVGGAGNVGKWIKLYQYTGATGQAQYGLSGYNTKMGNQQGPWQ